MEHMKIGKNLAQAILTYLVAQPYKDVYQLVEALSHMEEIPEEKKNDNVQSRTNGSGLQEMPDVGAEGIQHKSVNEGKSNLPHSNGGKGK